MTTQTVATAGQARATVRTCRAEDAPAILTAMLEALALGEYDAAEPYQLAHAVERLAGDPASGAVAEVDGHLAGWIVPGDDELMVLPGYRRRGVGRQLLAAGRVIAAAEGQALLRLWVRRQPGPEAFASASGLRYASSLWQMRLAGQSLAAVPGPAFPEGVAIRSFRLGEDEAPFVTLVNRIFLNHPSPIRLTEEEVCRVHATEGFDAGSILVVEDMATREMVGFCRVVRYTTGDGRTAGEIRLLGVDQPWRRKGLGRAVTAWGIAELRRRGAETVVLAVEGENEGAHHLYSDLGFRFGAEWPHWTIAATRATAG
jgi:mycothiol synthase